jgi:hypothetical protein
MLQTLITSETRIKLLMKFFLNPETTGYLRQLATEFGDSTKSTGIDKVISDILKRLGKIELAFIRGDYAIGRDSGLIDLVIVGETINRDELERVRKKTEKFIRRKIATLLLNGNEYLKLKNNFQKESMFILVNKRQFI